MSSPLNEDERAKVFLKFIKEGGSWTENLKRFEEGPDVSNFCFAWLIPQTALARFMTIDH